jgi:hypothetical protein
MTAPATIDVWMVEVLGDGIGQRHRRYLVLHTIAKQLLLRSLIMLTLSSSSPRAPSLRERRPGCAKCS